MLAAVGVGEDDRGVDGVVALAEDGRPHDELLADDGLGGAGAAVDDGADVLDGDAADGVLAGGGWGGRSHAPDATRFGAMRTSPLRTGTAW